jgi:ankyrin repeat protein
MSGTPQDDLLAKAAMFGNREMLEELLVNGADPNLPDSNGNCPLHEAAQYGETECASLLLTHKG